MSGSPDAAGDPAEADALAGWLAGADAVDGVGDAAPWQAANASAALASRPNKRLCINGPPKRVVPIHSHDQRPDRPAAAFPADPRPPFRRVCRRHGTDGERTTVLGARWSLRWRYYADGP